jgi:serine protease Do
MLALLSVLALTAATPLEDVVPKVDGSVVTIRVATRTQSQTETNVSMSVSISTGSGVVVLPQGYVVTAAHVVEDGEAIEVQWSSGFKSEASIVTLSHTEDIALLKVASMPEKPVVAKLGDSTLLKPGQRLFAIGAPYGLEHSITAGIVSALRENQQKGLDPRNLLQTDVPLNQGNSGGPLFNEAGEVVGIASFILSTSGGSVGLNFAVTSSSVRKRLFEHALPWVGVSLRYIPRDVAQVFNWPVESGFLVEKVRPGSPADLGGLKAGQVPSNVGGNDVILGGDLITRVNGVDTASTEKVAQVLRSLKGGQLIHYDLLRGGQPATVDIIVPEGVLIPTLPPVIALKGRP